MTAMTTRAVMWKKTPTSSAIELLDFYKVGHPFHYPQGMTLLSSNFTPRSLKHMKTIPTSFLNYVLTKYIDASGKDVEALLAPVKEIVNGIDREHVVWIGMQRLAIEVLIDYFNETFFYVPYEEAVEFFKEIVEEGIGPGKITYDHIKALHDLGYLPLTIRALPEGTKVPVKVPVLIVENTHKDFGWVTNSIESLLSCEMWKTVVNATIAYGLRQLLDKFAELTDCPKELVPYLAHDFSMRGMSGWNDAGSSGIGHAKFFTGSDNIPAISKIKRFYGRTYVGGSVPATEHSVACANIAYIEHCLRTEGHWHGENIAFADPDNTGDYKLMAERLFFKHYITEIVPTGIASYVSDTFDYFGVLTKVLPWAKQWIMARKPDAFGFCKVVVRPDSGDPLMILCGDPDSTDENERKGSAKILWEIFGGAVSPNGFKVVDSHIGLIYGDSITPTSLLQILVGFYVLGFSISICVYGIGSYTYQYVTRDSASLAMKATFSVVDGVDLSLQKDPKTDKSGKKSAKGRLVVVNDGTAEEPVYRLIEDATEKDFENDCMIEVFRDSTLRHRVNFDQVRAQN